MIIAIAAAPTLDRAKRAAELAAGKARIVADPGRGLVAARGFQTMYEVPRDLQTELRLALFDAHAAELDKGGPVVFDHCVAEWIADWMRWHWAAVSTRAWDAAMDKAAALAKRYDRVDLLREGPARGYDGYFWLDAPNARQIAELLPFVLARLGAKT
ncbi:MAG: hypothetical protein ACK5XA_10220 [Tagaea sp.]|jgi:hypothetical protein